MREFPSSDPPVISVIVGYRGASADVVQSQITEPLEDAVNGIAGIRTLTSSSGSGRASLRVEFELGSDLEAAANDVRDRVNGALDQLPPDIDPPEVSKDDADSQSHHHAVGQERARATWSSCRGSPTSSWSSGCRPSRASRRSTSGARRSRRCGSGSIRSGSPPTACRRSTCATRSSARTSSCRRAASRARACSSRCARCRASTRRRSSRTWSSSR